MTSVFVSATVAGNAITGSFANLIVATSPTVLLVAITSDTDKAVLISFGDDSNPIRLPAGQSMVLDLSADKTQSVQSVRIKHDGAAPTSTSKVSALFIQVP